MSINSRIIPIRRSDLRDILVTAILGVLIFYIADNLVSDMKEAIIAVLAVVYYFALGVVVLVRIVSAIKRRTKD